MTLEIYVSMKLWANEMERSINYDAIDNKHIRARIYLKIIIACSKYIFYRALVVSILNKFESLF